MVIYMWREGENKWVVPINVSTVETGVTTVVVAHKSKQPTPELRSLPRNMALSVRKMSVLMLPLLGSVESTMLPKPLAIPRTKCPGVTVGFGKRSPIVRSPRLPKTSVVGSAVSAARAVTTLGPANTRSSIARMLTLCKVWLTELSLPA